MCLIVGSCSGLLTLNRLLHQPVLVCLHRPPAMVICRYISSTFSAAQEQVTIVTSAAKLYCTLGLSDWFLLISLLDLDRGMVPFCIGSSCLTAGKWCRTEYLKPFL